MTGGRADGQRAVEEVEEHGGLVGGYWVGFMLVMAVMLIVSGCGMRKVVIGGDVIVVVGAWWISLQWGRK